jgi:ER membrane protein complex subunit 1
MYTHYYCDHAAGAAEGADATAGSTLTLWLVDTVSGRLLHRLQHQGAAGPVHCVVSENNVVCTHWSAKARRTEVSALHDYYLLVLQIHMYSDTALL